MEVDLRVTSSSHTPSGAAMSPVGIHFSSTNLKISYFTSTKFKIVYFEFLPPELLVEILNYMTDKELLYLRAVNTRFYNIITNMFTISIKIIKKQNEYFLKFEKSGIHLKIVRMIPKYNTNHVKTMNQYFNIFGRKTIKIINANYIYKNKLLIKRLPTLIPNLKEIIISEPNIILFGIMEQFTQLIKLSLVSCAPHSYPFYGISKLTNLEELFLCSDLQISEGTIGYLTNLTKITNFSSCIYHEDLIKLTNLRDLRLHKSHNLKNDSLSNLVNLENLYVSKNVISDQSLLYLTNLKSIEINYNNVVTDTSLSRLTKLEYLKVNSVPLIGDKSLLKLTNLTELTIANSCNITNDVFRYLSNLRYLSIYNKKSLNCAILKYTNNLTQLFIYNTLFDVTGDVLTRLTKLQKLRISLGFSRIQHTFNVTTDDLLKMKNLRYMFISACKANEELNKRVVTLEDLKVSS